MLKNKTDKIMLGNKAVGKNQPVFIIAEIANTHEGDLKTARKMVDKIKDTGVDAVKFQLHIHEKEMVSSHPKYHTQKKRSLSIKEIKELKKHVENCGLYFLCTPFSREAVDALVAMGVDAIKIGSGETTDLPFLEHVASKNKTIIFSTGMCSLKEVDEAVDVMKRHKASYAILHNVSIYPPEYKHLNLGNIQKFKKRYGVPIGLSDHTPEIYSSIAAIPYGVAIIEKHYTLNRSQEGTSDHKVSLEPHEFSVLTDGIRKIEQATGNKKSILDEEKLVIDWARHSVVSVKKIRAGEVVTSDMITTKRPLWDGIPANFLPKVIGKKTLHEIKKDSIIKWKYLV